MINKCVNSRNTICFCLILVLAIVAIGLFSQSKNGDSDYDHNDIEDQIVISSKVIADSVPADKYSEFNEHRYAGERIYNHANELNDYIHAYTEYQLALEELSAASNIFATDFTVNYKSAMCYFEMAKIDKTKCDLDMQKKDLEQADKHFEAAYSRRSDDPVMLHHWADTLFLLANMTGDDYKKVELLKDSLDKVEKAIEINSDLTSVRLLHIETLYEIASIEYDLGNNEAAFVYYSTLIDQSHDMDDIKIQDDDRSRVDRRVAYSYQCCAELKFKSQQLEDAVNYYNDAINIMTKCALRDNNLLVIVAELRYASAQIELEQDQIDNALNQCRLAASDLKRLSSYSKRLSSSQLIFLGDIHYKIAQILFWRTGDELGAYDHYLKASENYEGYVERREMQIECLKQMEKIMERVGDKKTVITIIKKRTKLIEIS